MADSSPPPDAMLPDHGAVVKQGATACGSAFSMSNSAVTVRRQRPDGR